MMGEFHLQEARSQNRSRVWCQLILAISWIVSSVVATPLFASEAASPPHKGVRDFAAYWASAQLLLEAQNPYSPADLFKIQRNLGLQEGSPLVMWNPPWTFAVTLPFGLFDFETGQFVWLLLHVSLLLLSARLLWEIYGEPDNSYRLAFLLTLTFVPSVFVLVIGQITPIVLVGLTGFLYFERQRKNFAAGAALALTLVKPHFVYLFWIVFALLMFQRRQWSLLAGVAVVGLVTAAIPLIFNPAVYRQYIDLFGPTELPLPLDLPAPTLRNVVKLLLQVEVGAAQNLLSVLALGWVVYYWWRHRVDWQWAKRLPLVLLVSVTTSAYTWTFDQVVFVPAIIQVAYWLTRQHFPWYRSIAALLFVAINLTHAGLRVSVAEELWYFWLAPALLVAYQIFLWESGRKHAV